ncbi:MAG: hypothetical protein EBS07_12685, partial [Sphingobacteriia bacterium]|nr:hypothetical protein [Sphingobacteriia bacterium]
LIANTSMKKLLTTLLFMGMLSQVSFSQIWESDTLPSKPGKKRYDVMYPARDFSSIFFLNQKSIIPDQYYRTATTNFGRTFQVGVDNQCCLNLILKNADFKTKIIEIAPDTIVAKFDLPAYSNYGQLIDITNFVPPGLYTNGGSSVLRAVSASKTFNYYSRSMGYIPTQINFVRSSYLFDSKSAVISLSQGLSDYRKERDTTSYTGIWRAGQPFITSQIETRFPILDFAFLNNNRLGFCAGYAGYIGKSTDQGLNWSKLTPPIKSDWSDLFFADSLNGWAYGFLIRDSTRYRNRIPAAIYTPDGGTTWFQINCDTSYNWKKRWFNSQGFGWAIRDSINNGSSQLVKTTDYGNSWSVQLSSRTERFEDMAFADTANGLIFSNFRIVSNNPPSKIYIKTSSTMGTFKKYLPKLELYPNPTSS